MGMFVLELGVAGGSGWKAEPVTRRRNGMNISIGCVERRKAKREQ